MTFDFLRRPGQFYDDESGLYYNFHRYYFPEIGRYISADPTGLDGGINLYAYVGGNPINAIDPEGLFNPDDLCPPNWEWNSGECFPPTSPECPPGEVPDPAGVCGRTDWPERTVEATETFGQCTAKCIGWVAVGEVGTSALFWKLSEFAGKLAWKAGMKVIPIAGNLSTAYSGFSLVKCMWDCQECPMK